MFVLVHTLHCPGVLCEVFERSFWQDETEGCNFYIIRDNPTEYSFLETLGWDPTHIEYVNWEFEASISLVQIFNWRFSVAESLQNNWIIGGLTKPSVNKMQKMIVWNQIFCFLFAPGAVQEQGRAWLNIAAHQLFCFVWSWAASCLQPEHTVRSDQTIMMSAHLLTVRLRGDHSFFYGFISEI